MNNRNWRVEIRVTYEEKKELEKKAKKVGLPQSTLIRFLIAGYEPMEKPDNRFYDLLNELAHASQRLRDTIYRLSRLGYMDTGRINKELDELIKLRMEIRREYLMPRKVKK